MNELKKFQRSHDGSGGSSESRLTDNRMDGNQKMRIDLMIKIGPSYSWELTGSISVVDLRLLNDKRC